MGDKSPKQKNKQRQQRQVEKQRNKAERGRATRMPAPEEPIAQPMKDRR